MALVITEPKGSDIRRATLDLELPEAVKLTLKHNLKPYLEAIQIDGYEDKKKRKVFMLGNTGKILFKAEI